jgi:hypothetical protein
MSSDPFPITAAQLSGNFCETLFFGMYLVTCTFCARTLLITGSGREERWLRPHEIRWLMAAVALILFVILTFDTAIGLLHNFHAFVKSDDPEEELLNIADWINIARVRSRSLARRYPVLISGTLVGGPGRRHDPWRLYLGMNVLHSLELP